MSAVLTLATPDHLARLDTLVAACHDEAGISVEPELRRAGIAPLLDGIPHGAAYLIGPPRAPIGYVIVTFGWSLEFAGMDGFIDEIYVRPGVRGRGIASEALQSLPRALASAGLKALHLEVRRDDESAQRLYTRSGFRPRSSNMLMTQRF